MAKCGENIYKRKDGRWEGRFIRSRRENGHAIYGYVYGRSYTECKGKLKEAAIAPPRMMCGCRLTAKELFLPCCGKMRGGQTIYRPALSLLIENTFSRNWGISGSNS